MCAWYAITMLAVPSDGKKAHVMKHNEMFAVSAFSTLILFLLTLILNACGSDVVGSTLLMTPTATIPLSVPACVSNQLAGQFIAGGYATGNATGEILLRNVSLSACTIHGNVGLSGQDAHGQRIAATKMNQPRVLTPVILPPHTPMASPGVEPTASAYLALLLIGAYRDDPTSANGVCSDANEVTPVWLVLSVGEVVVPVANDDPTGVGFKAMYGCHGVILGEGAALSS
jgi:hypothetical protein